ncbi:hypothetical protein [Bradyrhizobium sp. AS23.2]|uniref:hypothetical protein n=1 Tax=Bradyrhizobium sp. AS23.2 TaxID=1680155 RepID=UPI00093DD26B|nr:hypothetical protein [Bradyrhizobium sp. AS23.2]OKO73412.1 hypothetical protein AC630_28955 [Bradyrhizobium sp. AS23.2]
MTKSLDYSDLVQQAEKAVQGVKDPNLKSIAFQKILEELLGSGVGSRSPSTAPSPAKTRRQRSSSSGKSVKKPRGGPKSYVRELIADNFFKKQRTITEVKVELENRGHHIPLTSLSGPLQGLCRDRELRRSRSDGKFVYSVW